VSRAVLPREAGDLERRARAVLLENARWGIYETARGAEPFFYIAPARRIYPHQWLWDSCFHAIVMARLEPELAKAELRSLVRRARPDGFIPHLLLWPAHGHRHPLNWVPNAIARLVLHHLTQPPVLALAVEAVHQHTGDLDFVREVLPATAKHYAYFATHRDPDGDGLVSIVCPIESGMDNTPAYDMALGLGRPSPLSYHLHNVLLGLRYMLLRWRLPDIFAADHFSIEDLAFNCIYAAGLRSLARLYALVGDTASAEETHRRADRTEDAIITRCYHREDAAFYGLYSRAEQPARVPTVATLLPLLLERLPAELAERLVEQQLLDPERFWCPYPVPSVSMAHRTFNPASWSLAVRAGLRERLKQQWWRFRLIWRGPTWVNLNWLVVRGLRQHGFHDVADRLAGRTVEMVERAGFWEHYHPFTGEGQGAEHYSWSTLAFDLAAGLGNRGPAQTLAPALG
jgi:glycogen debranching enzyme